MEQIASQITDGFLENIPEPLQFYSPAELLMAKIPQFVIQAMKKKIMEFVENDLEQPTSDWFDQESEAVRGAWIRFVETSKREVRIPSDKLRDVLVASVLQCLKLTVQPRQTIAAFIFEGEPEINTYSAKERVSELPVNRHLGLALVKYMEKKEKSTLTLEDARELIQKIDQKLVSEYHPLNWAQVLKPLFELAGPAVDTDLLRMFFEDKGEHRVAKKFDLMDTNIDETEFIEVMSSPDLLEVDVDEDDQQQLFEPSEPGEEIGQEEVFPEDDQTETDINDEVSEPAKQSEEEVFNEDTEADVESTTDEVQDTDAEQDEESAQEVRIVDLFTTGQEQQSGEEEPRHIDLEEVNSDLSLVEEQEKEDEEKGNAPLLSRFMFDEDSDEDEENAGQEKSEVESPAKEPNSIYDELNLVQESDMNKDLFDGESVEMEELSFQIPTKEEVPSSEQEENENENDLPMWRSFLERDDIEAESGFEYESEAKEETAEHEEEVEEEMDDEGFIEEPIYDLTVSEPDPEENISEISKWLDDEKDRFIEKIFKNSEMAYEEALLELVDFDDWKSASRYLEREIFSRNRVEVYDEVAIDFTDRLQSYFLEQNS